MRGFTHGLSLLFGVGAFAAPILEGIVQQRQASWPDLPLKTEGRDVKSSSGANVIYAGVNWPGAADAMLPEGLQYRSSADIASDIKSLGMNVVRLTYAIEMIDDYYENNPNQTLQNTLVNALGQDNGATVLSDVLKNNPQFTAATTRLEVFDDVAAELAKQQIWVHLDNHVSKAQWCCSTSDGNAWFGDTYFNVFNWQRGLGFMANRTKSWTNLASMGLRNELREADDNPNPPAAPYDWQSWYENMVPAAQVINGNNSDTLIFFGGMGYDTDLSTIAAGKDIGNGQTFNVSSFPFGDKIVFELHNYQNSAGSCDDIKSGLYSAGYGSMAVDDLSFANHAPVVMSEFGFSQTDGSDESVYAECIKDFLTSQPGGPGGWMQWTLSGSYYIREGTQDADDSWGLVSHDWSTWRNETVINEYVKLFVEATLG